MINVPFPKGIANVAINPYTNQKMCFVHHRVAPHSTIRIGIIPISSGILFGKTKQNHRKLNCSLQ